MIEKHFTAAVAREFVQYPGPIFAVVNNMPKDILNMIKELLENILMFDLCLYKKNLNHCSKRNSEKSCEPEFIKNIAIYSVTDSIDSDVKKVLNIMKIFND